MLQNKKTAPVSGGLKSFVCVGRFAEKVTEWLECNLQERLEDRRESVDEWRCWVVRRSAQGRRGHLCGVEVWRGGLGGAYRLPTLSSVGASLVPPCFRFHTPLIEPDVRICRIRLSEKTHAIAIAIACDAVCNF